MPSPALSLVVALTFIPALAGAQPGAPAPKPSLPIPAGNSSIAGRVVEQGTDQALAGVIVTLTSVDRAQALATMTDDTGRYALTHVAAGAYRVIASHAGYVTMELGLKAGRSDTTPRSGVTTLEADVARTNADFALVASLTVSGRVIRHDGRPVANARVVALWQGDNSGDVSRPPSAFARTNSRGEYMLSNLPDGLYQISALTDGDWRTSKSIFYPGATRAEDATPLKVSRGESTSNIDLVFPASEMLRISGSVLRSNTSAETEAFVMSEAGTFSLSLAADGSFTTPELRAGRYTLAARTKNTDDVEAASTTIDLSDDVRDVVLGLLPAGTIAGRVVTDDGSAPPALMLVGAAFADGGKEIEDYPRDRVGITEGRFLIRGVFGSRILRVVGVTDGWKVKRVMRGRDQVTAIAVTSGDTIADVIVELTR